LNTSRYLITTADERSWKFDRPVLFLGEWCRLYHRKEVWSGMEAQVVGPFGLEKNQKEKDRSYVQVLANQLLIELAGALNEFHKTNHNQRYWNIVLGYWLQRYVSVAFNRYFSIEKAFKEYEISGTVIFDLPNYTLATFNSLDFLWALYDNVWNHIFYARVLTFLGLGNSELQATSDNGNNFYKSENNVATERGLRAGIYRYWDLFFRNLSRNRDAFVMGSYLPFSYAAQLQLSLGQFPGFWASPKPPKAQVNPDLRSNLKIELSGFNGFELFVRKMLIEVLPTCYLEGYVQLVRQTRLLPWPSKPKFIFTSSNFDMDEVFKVWTAQKVEEGYKYFIGQHGNLYGTWIYHNCDIPEFSTPDKFISWGWGNGNPKIVPAFIFKTVNQKQVKKVSQGGLLLIERCIYNRLATYDRYINHDIYQKEQFRFVDSLPENIQQLLTVRLFRHKLGNQSWSDEQRWKDYDPSIKLDLGSINIWKIIRKNRLTVFSYDSTGFLEMLSLNMPTISFWNGLFDEILPEAIPYYELLKDAGILWETPEDAAEFITLNWDRLEDWWFSKRVQDARIVFCDKYAKTVARPVRELKRILTSDISSAN
jgi:putative transferase (TIGR04331 family)